MAKELKTAESTELTTDADFEAELQQDAGKGVSTAASDNLVPLIYVLQPLSPQVMSGPAQIEGAKAGDIWLKNASDPIVSGKKGIWFMPCTMYMRWTEWVPREKGGGFISSYDYQGYDKLPPGAERDTSVKNRPSFHFPETGNDLVETRYEAGIVWRDGNPTPYVIPFKSTGHAVSRGWMSKRVEQRRPDGTIWPSWTHLYRLTTTMKKNNYGQWFIFEVSDPVFYIPGYKKQHTEGLKIVGGDYRRTYAMGKALAAAFEQGQKREEQEDSTVERSENTKVDDEIPF